MSLLDTNVVSALMLPKPPVSVVRWMDARETSSLFVSTVTIAEIAVGVQALPGGKRRRAMQSRFRAVVEEGFDRRVLSFDSDAAHAYAEVVIRRKRLGRPLGVFDAQIAAIARANHLRVATRNIRDFEDCGVALVDPFTASA